MGSKMMKRVETPTQGAPDGPYLWKYLMLSGFIGACLFTCLAYLLELADRSYRGPEEIATDLGVPILGHIQMSNLSRKDRKDEKIDLSMVTFHKPKSTASEAFRGVRTSIYFGNQAGSIKVIQITSPVPGDGKSTVAAISPYRWPSPVVAPFCSIAICGVPVWPSWWVSVTISV